MNKQQKYLILGLLYFTQTIPIAFMGHALPVILRENGVSLTTIAFFQIALMPYAFSFLWAPLVDRYGKSYFRWVTVATLLYGVFLVPVSVIGFSDKLWMVSFMTLAVISMSTQDLAIDAWAIRSLNEEERSIGNGIQSAGNYLGFLLGGGLFLIFYRQIGWKYSVLILAMVTMLPMILTIRHERAGRKTESVKKVNLKDFIAYFRIKDFHKWIPVLLFFKVPMDIVFYFVKPLLIDKGFSLEQVGFLFGIVAMCSAALFGFGGGILLRSVTLRNKLLAGLAASLLSVVAGLVLSETAVISYFTAIVLCSIVGGAAGLSIMVLYHVSMKNIRPGKEASDYAFQTFLRSFFFMALIPAGGFIADRYGYATLFYLMLILCICMGVVVCFNYRTSNEKPVDSFVG